MRLEEKVSFRMFGKIVKRTAVGSIVVALLTFVCFRAHTDLASAIPLYMFLVIAQSMTGDFISAAIVCVLSAGCLDFFFTIPLFSLYISNPRNVVALIAFLFAALVITRLVSRLREEATFSKLQKDRLDRLYKLSQQLLALEPDDVMSENFLDPFRQLFGVTAICVFDAATANVHVVGGSQYKLENRTREAYISGHDLTDPKLRLTIRCLRTAGSGKMDGAIGFEGLVEAEETTGALAVLAAVLVAKAKAFREANEAEAAAQAEAYRSAVLDALAHEFKTPLATILAAAGGIRDAGLLGPAQQELTNTVENEAVRLGKLTSRLLRTARLEREDIKPRMELIDVASLAAQVATQYAERSPDSHISLVNSDSEIEASGDPELLRLALSQLVDNACKYSVPGSSIVIETEQDAKYVSVKVSNTGSSIPSSERDQIFERFYRGAEARRCTPGSGLGLYVARKIVVAHGGALTLELDHVKRRVTFCIKIPVNKEALSHVSTNR